MEVETRRMWACKKCKSGCREDIAAELGEAFMKDGKHVGGCGGDMELVEHDSKHCAECTN